MLRQTARGGDPNADEGDSRPRRQRHDGHPIETARVFVATIPLVEILDDEKLLAHHEVVADENARNWAEKTGVPDEPAENVAAVVPHPFPRLHEDAHGTDDEAAGSQ